MVRVHFYEVSETNSGKQRLECQLPGEMGSCSQLEKFISAR